MTMVLLLNVHFYSAIYRYQEDEELTNELSKDSEIVNAVNRNSENAKSLIVLVVFVDKISQMSQMSI